MRTLPLLFLAACSSEPSTVVAYLDGGVDAACSADDQCVDGDPCTFDLCEHGGCYNGPRALRDPCMVYLDDVLTDGLCDVAGQCCLGCIGALNYCRAPSPTTCGEHGIDCLECDGGSCADGACPMP